MTFNIPEKPVSICRTLDAAGFDAWLVGGAVRDLLMGREPHDWDVATNARPGQVVPLFARVIETGLKHGTVTVLLGGEHFEVTTYRTDGAYSDGRRPDGVVFIDRIEQDLERRDFTVNAIAYDPLRDYLLDPFGGASDIRAGVILAVGVAVDRFNEDSLRALRAIRFAATLRFRIDPATMTAIHACELRVAPERVQAELVKGLLAGEPDRFLHLLLQSGLLAKTLPEMLPMVGCAQNKYHAYDVWEHTLRVVAATPADVHLRLAATLHDVAKPAVKGAHPSTGETTFYDHENAGAEMADAIMARLKFSNDDRARVTHLIHHHLVPQLQSPSSIRRWVRKVGRENVADIFALARADAIGKGQARQVGTSVEYLEKLQERITAMEAEEPTVTATTQLAITGDDVMTALGISPGPDVGRVLKVLLELVTDDPAMNEREALMATLKGPQ